MNNVVVMAFTSKGYALAEKIAGILFDAGFNTSAHRVSALKEFVRTVYKKGNILIFVGSAGIAVRGIAGLIKDKTTDPAVIVIDELGRYVIPILSGHIGGANRFAEKLSGLIHAEPVITTATDINKIFSVDAYAVQNRYTVANPEYIKYISGALLDGQEVGLHTPFEISGKLPDNIVLKSNGNVGISIDKIDKIDKNDKNDTNNSIAPFAKTLKLIPKCFHVGIGAKRNIRYDVLHDYFLETLSKESIPISCVGSVSSIDLKKDEEAIVKLAETYDIDFLTYSAGQLKIYEHLFGQSDFVRKTTGVGNVCETAAYLSSGKGDIIAEKRAGNGMTIAIAKEVWRVVFENTDDRA